MNPYLGEIRLFAGMFAPVGWHFCDGSLLDISGNDALYSLMGTTYGGNGQTNFALPDLRGRLPIHRGQGAGLSQYTIGQVGGAEQVTLTTQGIPAHHHQLIATTNAGTTNDPTGKLIASGPSGCLLFDIRQANTAYNPAHVAASGNNQPHENRQPYIAINYIIALAGVYPSQS